MGFDPELFVNTIDDELKCPICFRVLEDPMQGQHCDHIFCGECIDGWLLTATICPMDRMPLLRKQLKPVSKMVTNILSRLEVKCPNEKNGCCLTLPLGALRSHLNGCENNELGEKRKLSNPLSVIREMCVSNKELSNFQETVELLKQQFLEDKLRGQQLSERIEEFYAKLDECKKDIHEAFDPLLALILGGANSSNDSSENDNEKLVDVYVQNLCEFTNEGLLFEYLRQNDIQVQNIQCNKTVYARSLTFVLTMKKYEVHKVLVSQLWPIGVSAFIRGEKTNSINGDRSKCEPTSVLLESGITCYSRCEYFR
ncbi:E3 ubiquitin-protein ligase NRDP1-like protein [Leptotrombidium deliense]|uniref:E3 ubiquitin-protein ligase NRDP1-like protein n=1 Tax=Leptotrombidium deliense TaxID=299467 RepID=A0A443S6V6_9ACAR|nr:E3 ubiquitin-protein ligase NRDP1-like protein [Leptotrombidium deliense]